MAPSTALLLLLLAVALGLHQRWAGRPAVRILKIAAAAITGTAAVAVIIQNLAGLDPHWERWLAGSNATVRGIPVGQMSPFTAGMFLLAAFSLVTLHPVLSQRVALRRAGKIAVFFGGSFCAITALAYATGTPLFYGGGVVPMAFLTAIALVGLNLALLIASRIDRNAYDFLVGDASRTARTIPLGREQTLLIGLTTAAFAIVALVGPLYLRHQQTKLKSGIAAQLTAIATLKVNQMTTWRDERIWDARRLMRTPYLGRNFAALVANPQDATSRAELFAWMEQMITAQDVDAVVLFDAEMNPLLAAPIQADVSDPQLRALLQSVPRARDVRESDIHRGKAGTLHMDIVAPILDEHRPMAVGAILLRINPERLLYPLLQTWPVPSETAETCLFRCEGNELVYLNTLRHHPGAALTVRGSLENPELLGARIIRGEGGAVVEGIDIRGVPVVGVGRPVPGTRWFIMAKMDQAEAYGPLRQEALMVIVATIAILCAVVLGGSVLWRQRKHVLLEREIEAERERSALAERLALVTRYANDIIFLMDADGRILEANDRALASYGYTLDELKQLPPGGLRAAASGGNSSQPLDDRFGSPGAAVFEKIHQRKDGSLFPVEVSRSEFEDNGRRFKLGIYRDISQRKKHEEQIERLTRLYAALSQINQTIVRTHDRNELFGAICRILVEYGGFKTAWIGWHDAGANIITPVASFGDGSGSLQGIRIDADESPENRDPTSAAVRRGCTVVSHGLLHEQGTAMRPENSSLQGSPASIALPIRRSSRVVGALTVFAAGVSAIGDKEITLLEEAAIDVSFALDNFDREGLRQQAKAALRQSEEEHRLLFLNHPIPTWIYDAETLEFIAVNHAAVSHYGYTREEFLAMTIKDIRPDADVPALLKAATEIAGSRRQTGPWRHRKKNGEIILVEISSEPVSFEARPARLVLAEDITLRQRAQEELRQSEERYRSLFANLVEGFAYCQMIFENGRPVDFIYLEVNPAFSTLTGLSGVVGRKVSEIIPGIRESDPELFERYGRVAQTGRSERFETYVVGLKMWFDISVYRPAPDCFVAVFDVITTRKRHEEQLALLNTALLAAADSVVITDEHGVIEWVNPAFSKCSGYSFEDAVGENIRLLKSGQQSEKFYSDLWHTITSGRNWHGEFVNKHKDGRLYIEDATIAPVRDIAGSIKHFVAIKHDVTLRKDAERRLHEQAELLDKANDAIVVSDLKNCITFWNRAAARLFGWSAAEMIGMPLDKVFAFGGGLTPLEPDSPVATASDQRRKIRVHNRNGDPLVIETSVTVLFDETGRPTGQLSISTDVTEKEKLEEKFLRTQRLESIGILAAGITHDLNNVLAPIGMASTLLRSHHSDASALRLLDTLDRCVARGAGLVRQILGFVHGIGGEPRIVEIKHLLRDIVEVITETYPKSIILEENVPGDLWPILANPTQIHQVLLNLCVNARDAMPDGGILRLCAENCVLDAESVRAVEGCEAGLAARPGSWLVLHVEDTGSGIPPELLARVWEPFFSTKAADKGTGLGLSTVRGIVETHHGFLTLHTERGRGSTFRIYLPAAAPAFTDRAPAGVEPAGRGHNELILLVDDEVFIRDTAQAVLANAGYQVITAADGVEAIALFESRADEIALVITDLDMPNLDGAGLAQRVHAYSPAMKILKMSGAGSTRRPTVGAPENLAPFLPKPFTAERLLNSVEQLLHGNSTPIQPASPWPVS